MIDDSAPRLAWLQDGSMRAVIGVLTVLVAIIGVSAVVLRDDVPRESRGVSVGTASTIESSLSAPVSTPTQPTRTTVTLVPVGPPKTLPRRTTTTTIDPALTTTSAAPTTTTPPNPIVGSAGAWLRPGSEPGRTRSGTCKSLGSAGFTPSCGEANGGGVDVVWLTESKGAQWNAFLFRRTIGDDYEVALSWRSSGSPDPIDGITVRQADLSGSGSSEIIFGFRVDDDERSLVLDVVELPGRVVIHRTIESGRATARSNVLTEYAGVYADDDEPCCPTEFKKSEIRREDGAWRVTSTTLVPSVETPNGDF